MKRDIQNSRHQGEKKIALEELEKDHKIIEKFMEKYGDEWRKLDED